MTEKKASPSTSKQDIRQKVWDFIETNDLANFPRPVYRRIPNFTDANAAAEKITSMPEFDVAKTVKINPDKPQEWVRFLALQRSKDLLVPTPRLKDGLFNRILPPDNDQATLKKCATTEALRHFSKPVDLDSKVHIDLIVSGSVAVSRKGFRIGKGEGFADLEYGMMRAMEAIDDNTIVITTVHDCQVIDIPEDTMEPHDFDVDYILTPTQLIKCERCRTNPKGIIWSQLSPSKLKQVPILQTLREKEKENGVDVTLKEEDEEAAERREANRFYRRRPKRGIRGSKGPNGIVPAVFVRKIPEEVRTSAFKAEVKDKGVFPSRFLWRGGKGYALLFFEEVSEAEKAVKELEGFELEGKEVVVELSNAVQEEKEPADEGSDRKERDRRRPRYRNQNRNNRNQGRNDRNQKRKVQNSKTSDRQEAAVYVGKIPEDVRASSFKSEVKSKGVQPFRFLWRGGYALLFFKDKTEAEDAVKTMEGFELDGQSVVVELSSRRERESPDRKRDQERDEETPDESEEENERNRRSRGGRFRRGGPRRQNNTNGHEPAVYVGKIPEDVRVSSFKADVKDKGVNPLKFLWRGGKGYALLFFSNLTEAETAVQNLEGFELEGKEVIVELSIKTKETSESES